MSVDAAWMFGFLTFFLRASAALLIAPVIGGMAIPVSVRVGTAAAIGAALATSQPAMEIPDGLHTLAIWAATQIGLGLVLGFAASLIVHAATIAGAVADFQLGLATSQLINPVSGVPVTVFAQLKSLLAAALYVSVNGHHLLLVAIAGVEDRAFAGLITNPTEFVMALARALALGAQIGLPLLACGFLVDAALGILNRAVPQMHALTVGVPLKVGLGLLIVSLSLPMMMVAITGAVEAAFEFLAPAIRSPFAPNS